MSKEIKTIQVLGSGCPTCKLLYESTKKVVEEMKIDVAVQYLTDVTKMIEMGVMQSPALVVNGRPVLTGGGKSEADIKNILEKNFPSNDQSSGGCSCCSGCC